MDCTQIARNHKTLLTTDESSVFKVKSSRSIGEDSCRALDPFLVCQALIDSISRSLMNNLSCSTSGSVLSRDSPPDFNVINDVILTDNTFFTLFEPIINNRLGEQSGYYLKDFGRIGDCGGWVTQSTKERYDSGFYVCTSMFTIYKPWLGKFAQRDERIQIVSWWSPAWERLLLVYESGPR